MGTLVDPATAVAAYSAGDNPYDKFGATAGYTAGTNDGSSNDFDGVGGTFA